MNTIESFLAAHGRSVLLVCLAALVTYGELVALTAACG